MIRCAASPSLLRRRPFRHERGPVTGPVRRPFSVSGPGGTPPAARGARLLRTCRRRRDCGRHAVPEAHLARAHRLVRVLLLRGGRRARPALRRGHAEARAQQRRDALVPHDGRLPASRSAVARSAACGAGSDRPARARMAEEAAALYIGTFNIFNYTLTILAALGVDRWVLAR